MAAARATCEALRAMGRRISLPLTDELGSAPTVAAMRKRLGGRVEGATSVTTPAGEVTVGSFVALPTGDGGAKRAGVLLTIDGDAVDVYVASGLVRRTRVELIAPTGGANVELAPIAESAALFARLGEGQAVLVEPREGEILGGTLVEKCRYGALVKLDATGAVLAVGFRRVWPARAAVLSN